MNIYKTPPPFAHVLHADLYRLRDEDDLESTGYWDAVDEADLVIVEWIDQVPAARPTSGWLVHLAHTAAGRSLKITRFE
jgi:tRNA A37 threonylcarbamoyladenosine biosynthesis protein TsaE